MKTAEQWAVEIWQVLKERFISGATFALNIVPFIRQIQLDAIKHGMELAAIQCDNKSKQAYSEGFQAPGSGYALAALAIRHRAANLKEIPKE